MKSVINTLEAFSTAIYRILYFWRQHVKYDLQGRLLLRKHPQGNLSRIQRAEIRSTYRRFGFTRYDLAWHRLLSGLYGSFNAEFVPGSLFISTLEHRLNNQEYIRLQDKNLLERLLQGFRVPTTILGNARGSYLQGSQRISSIEGAELLAAYDRFIIKPSIHTGGGRNVQLVALHGLNREERLSRILELFTAYKQDFVVQHVLEQSEYMASFNPTSTNTLRIITFLSEENGPVLLRTVLRFGKEGAVVDNLNSGGFFVGVDNDGYIQGDRCFDKSLQRQERLTINSGPIPCFSEVIETICAAHVMIPYFKLISWDVALNKDNQPVILEFNTSSQGFSWQAAFGPLFGPYFQEAMEFARTHPDPKLG